MLNLNTVIKELANPQNLYDVTLLGLTYMPAKPVAVAIATLLSGSALYLVQPQTLLSQISVVAISSGFGYGITIKAQQVASKLWDNRWEEIKASVKPISPDAKRKLEEAAEKALDDLFADSEFLKDLNTATNQTKCD